MKALPAAFVLTLVISGSVRAAHDMTPEQLAKAVLATYAKYETLSCDYQMTIFRYGEDGRVEPSPASKVDGTWRATNERRLEHARSTFLDAPELRTSDVTLAGGPRWVKQLHLPQSLLQPSLGAVAPPGIGGPEWMGYDVLLDRDVSYWKAVTNDAATVVEDPKTGNYVLTAELSLGRADPFHFSAEVSPKYGFIPVRTEFIPPNSDGVAFQFEANDFREVGEGLWLPFRVRHDLTKRDVSEYKVRRVEVNVPIPDEDLDIVFPDGTIVNDEISGVRYEVTVDHSKGILLDDRPLSPRDLKASRPVSDETLEGGYHTGRELSRQDRTILLDNSGMLKRSSDATYLISIAAAVAAVAFGITAIILRRNKARRSGDAKK